MLCKTIRRLLRAGVCCLPVAVLTSTSAFAQSKGLMKVWHGVKEGEYAMVWSYDGTDEGTSGTRRTRYVEPGDSICVSVPNAHPVFYNYSIAAETLKVNTTLPVAPMLLQLASLPGAAAFGAESGEEKLAGLLDGLAQQIGKAQMATYGSDAPEPLGSSRSSYLLAVDSVRIFLNQVPQRNAGESIADMVTRWIAATRSEVANKLFLKALESYGQALVSQASALQKGWTESGATYRNCLVIGSDPVRVKLVASVKDADHAKARLTGAIATFDVKPKYRDELIRVTPVFTLSVGTRGEPNYQVRDGAVVDLGDSDQLIPQVGALLSVRIARWSADESFTARLGIGANVINKDHQLSRFFGALLVGYRDVLSVGLGIGRTRTEVLTDSTILGKPLPSGKNLKDYFQAKPENRPAVYLTFSLANLDALSGLSKLLKKD